MPFRYAVVNSTTTKKGVPVHSTLIKISAVIFFFTVSISAHAQEHEGNPRVANLIVAIDFDLIEYRDDGRMALCQRKTEKGRKPNPEPMPCGEMHSTPPITVDTYFKRRFPRASNIQIVGLNYVGGGTNREKIIFYLRR